MKTINKRNTEYDVNDIFLNRYSPRAMSGELITTEELMTLFEAARWAPSSRNEQPWRFLYAMKGTPDFELFFSFFGYICSLFTRGILSRSCWRHGYF